MSQSDHKRSPILSYRDLRVWQAGMDLVVNSYKITGQFPDGERYGLVTQIRRAAVSVPSNIAEGYGRNQLGDYIRHLSISNGSLKELETQMLIANRLGFVGAQTVQQVLGQTARIGRMLAALIRKLKQRRRELAPGRPKP